MGSYQQGVLTELLQTVYQAKEITQNPRTWRKPLPTFHDPWVLLEEREQAPKGRAAGVPGLAPCQVSALSRLLPLLPGTPDPPLPPKAWVWVDLAGLPHELQYLAVDVLIR